MKSSKNHDTRHLTDLFFIVVQKAVRVLILLECTRISSRVTKTQKNSFSMYIASTSAITLCTHPLLPHSHYAPTIIIVKYPAKISTQFEVHNNHYVTVHQIGVLFVVFPPHINAQLIPHRYPSTPFASGTFVCTRVSRALDNPAIPLHVQFNGCNNVACHKEVVLQAIVQPMDSQM